MTNALALKRLSLRLSSSNSVARSSSPRLARAIPSPSSAESNTSGSLAYSSLSAVLHAAELAPERQAFASGTAWSMSTSEESVNVCPVYGSTYVLAVMEQSSSIWTPLPSHPEGFPERTDSQVDHLALQQPQ
jgi:predicted NAD/FAD-binding protein